MSRTVDETLADAVLAQNATVGQLIRSLDRVLLQLQAATNAMEQQGMNHHELRHELKMIAERLAVLSKDVDDVERFTREASGVFTTHAPVKKEHAAVGIIEAFGRLPRWSQMLIVLALLLLAIVTPMAVYLWKSAGG